ncbi:MAG: hypothetical protein ABI995_08465 [Acidobacteriota bacterium]
MTVLQTVAFILFSSIFTSGLAFAQTAAWDNSPKASELAAQAARLKPLLDQLKPAEWVARGASDTYVKQWNSAYQELEYLTASAAQLDKQPHRLTAALDTYFRLQALEWHFESLIEGVRKYQNPAVGDLLLGALRGNSGNRDGLREYILDLANQKEQEFTIIDQEAQRCRVQLNQIPTVRKSK